MNSNVKAEQCVKVFQVYLGEKRSDRCRISEEALGRSQLLQIYILYAYLFGSCNSLDI